MNKILIKSADDNTNDGYYFIDLEDLTQILPLFHMSYGDYWHAGVFKSRHKYDAFIYVEPYGDAKAVSLDEAKKICLNYYNSSTDETKDKIESTFNLTFDII